MAKTSPDRYIARILNRETRKPVGVAFAAGDRQVVTCAHVVNAALGRAERTVDEPAEAWVEVEFPFAADSGSRVTRTANVARWMPRDGLPFEETDVAGLRLEADLPPGVEPATLAADEGPSGERRVGAWGPNRDGGPTRAGNVAGSLTGSYDTARLQADVDLRGSFRVQAGYSGGPVWDQGTGQVVGIVQAVPRTDKAEDVYVISAETLVRAWPEVLYRPPPNPYRGLSAFTEADAPFFFGRTTFVTELADATVERPLVVVAGRSGVGKSSVVAAGLVPRLRARDSWAVGTFRPGDDPMPRLAGALAEAAGTRPPYSIHELRAWQDRLTEGLAAAAAYVCAARGSSRMLLIIDQFEQVFTECGPEQRSALLALLNRVVLDGPRTLRVALSLRNDFHYLLTEADPPLGAYAKDHWHHLQAMTAEELRLAVTEPARVAGGVAFDEGLAGLICEEFEGRPGELPLLEFTLTRLWELQRGRRLTLQSYRDLGGVNRTLASYAEERFSALTPAQRESARRVFTELLQPENAQIARQIRRVDLRAGDWATAELLRDARLLAVSTASNGEQIVEVAHEALLRGWDRLRGWAAESQEFRTWKAGVIADRQRWENNGRDPDLLLRGPLLVKALDMIALHSADSGGVTEYITLSSEYADRTKAERRNVLYQLAAPRLARQGEEASHSGLKGPQLALALGISSLQSAPTAEGERAIRLALTLAARPLKRLVHDATVFSVSFSADGRRLATAGPDGSARVWDTESGVELARLSHGGWVYSAVFSPDGGRVVTAGRDMTARIWDAESGVELLRLVHQGWVWSAVFSPDGERVATACDAGSALVWDARSGAELVRLRHPAGVESVAFSPDGGRLVAVGRNGRARVWHWESAEMVFRPEDPVMPGSVAFSPDGGRLVTVDRDGPARVWDANTGAHLLALAHEGAIRAADFSPDGSQVATAGEEGWAHVWEVESGVVWRRFRHGDKVRLVVISPDARRLVTVGSEGSARVWDIWSGAELARLGQGGEIWWARFSPDGQRLVTAGKSRSAWLWDAAFGPEQFRLGHGEKVRSVVFSPDGTRLATVSADGSARMWDAITGAEKAAWPDHLTSTSALVFSPDGNRIAAISHNSDVAWVWDTESGACSVGLTHDDVVWSVAFSPDGSRVLTGSADGSARVWDARSGAELLRLLHSGAVRSAAFSPSGRRIASGSWDRTAKVWDAASGAELVRLCHDGDVRGVVFGSDDTRLATVCGGSVRLWDVESGVELAQMTHAEWVLSVRLSPDGTRVATVGQSGWALVWDTASGAQVVRLAHDGPVGSVAFSPDGRRVATAGKGGSARLWNADTGLELARLPHEGHVRCVVFSPDGSRVATAGEDGTVRLWAVSAQELISQALGRLTRNLTQEEWFEYLGPDIPYRRLREDLP